MSPASSALEQSPRLLLAPSENNISRFQHEDESQGPSRKRQRTSTSPSPIYSSDFADPIKPDTVIGLLEQATAPINKTHHDDQLPSIEDEELISRVSEGTTTGDSPSKVTINLRSTQTCSSPPPASPISVSVLVPGEDTRGAEQQDLLSDSRDPASEPQESPEDPTQDFPCRSAGDGLVDTLHQLRDHLLSSKSMLQMTTGIILQIY